MRCSGAAEKPTGRRWPVEGPLANGEAVAASLATLQPKTDAQKAKPARANISRRACRTRQASHVPSGRQSASLVGGGGGAHFWTLALFFSIGLFERATPWFSRRSRSAMCGRLRHFPDSELGEPYSGAFKVSPAALQQTVQDIDESKAAQDTGGRVSAGWVSGTLRNFFTIPRLLPGKGKEPAIWIVAAIAALALLAVIAALIAGRSPASSGFWRRPSWLSSAR